MFLVERPVGSLLTGLFLRASIPPPLSLPSLVQPTSPTAVQPYRPIGWLARPDLAHWLAPLAGWLVGLGLAANGLLLGLYTGLLGAGYGLLGARLAAGRAGCWGWGQPTKKPDRLLSRAAVPDALEPSTGWPFGHAARAIARLYC